MDVLSFCYFPSSMAMFHQFLRHASVHGPALHGVTCMSTCLPSWKAKLLLTMASCICLNEAPTF